MDSRTTILRLLPLFVLAAGTTTALADPAVERFAVHRWSVDEQTTGILVRDTRAPAVYVNLEFPVGSWSGWAAHADLRSAMAIQIYDPAGELRRRSDNLAATVSAGASSRHAWVAGMCLDEDVAGLQDLIRDVLANESFDRKELKRWKQQAKLSWKATETDVYFRGRQLVARSLFRPGDPRRRSYDEPRRVETDPAELVRIRNLIVRLPGRTIGLAGDLTPEEAEALAARLLPPASHGSEVDTRPALLPLRPPEHRSDSEVRVRRLTQVYFGLSRESLAYGDTDYPAFVLANHVLGGHFYSRIMVALRHEGGETYGAFATAEKGAEPGKFVIGSYTKTDNAPYAEAKLRKALRILHDDGITEEERADAVDYLNGRAPFDRQAPHQVLHRLMLEQRLGLPAGFLDEVTARAAALTLDEINNFIDRYYAPGHFVMGRVAPAGD